MSAMNNAPYAGVYAEPFSLDQTASTTGHQLRVTVVPGWFGAPEYRYEAREWRIESLDDEPVSAADIRGVRVGPVWQARAEHIQAAIDKGTEETHGGWPT